MVVSFPVGSTGTLRIIESIGTGSHSPEEMLARLDEYDIPWHITEEGDLMIRYWQIVAEDFVPREHVARVRHNCPVPGGADALEWVSRHLEELGTLHGGKWVAIAGNRVVASSDTLPELMEALQRTGIESPFITQIPADPIVWRSVYGGKIF